MAEELIEGGAAAAFSGSICPTEYDCDRYVLGVGCSGIANGIWELGPGSRETGDVCISELKKEFPPPGGSVDVGEGKTSLSRAGGSLRSEFQIVPLHGKVDAPVPRPITDEVE